MSGSRWLRARGAERVWLAQSPQGDPRISDRMSAGFIGGGGNSEHGGTVAETTERILGSPLGSVESECVRPANLATSPTDGFPRHKAGLLRIRISLWQKVVSLTASPGDSWVFCEAQLWRVPGCFPPRELLPSTDSKRHGYHTDLAPRWLAWSQESDRPS